MKSLFALLAIPLLAASSASTPKPVRWIVIGGDRVRSVTAGRPTEVVLQAEIARGWYIYSLTQKPGGPRPLRIQLVDAADVGITAAIRAPVPVKKFDPNFGIETELHFGKPRFVVPVGVRRGSLTGKRELKISARYQACSETVCLPPRTEKLGLRLQVER